MITNVKKTTPSEVILLAWLAGIIDGEGSIGIYDSKTRGTPCKIFNLSIVNTDNTILLKVEDIYKHFNIFFSRYIHNNPNPKGFLPTNQCYVVTVRRRDDFEQILKLIEPFLIGKKKQSTQKALEYLVLNPRKAKPVYYCKFCKKAFTGRKKQFCTLKCWHDFSIGDKNPNFRHGKYITRND